MKQSSDTAPEMPRALVELLDTAVTQSERERRIALEALHTLSRQNSSNLATRILRERSTGMSAVAKQARTTLTEGRKYIKPTDFGQKSRMQLLARSIEKAAPNVPEALVLVE